MCLLGACKEGDAEKVMELLQEVADFDFSQVGRYVFLLFIISHFEKCVYFVCHTNLAKG